MKKIVSIFSLCLLFLSCSDNGFNNNNPYIPNYNFSITFDLNLPAYSNLKYVSNAIYYSGPEVGPKGIYVFNTGTGYTAFDGACPNQALSSCSTLTLKGINVVCPCDEEEYSLFTGQGKLQYPLKQYRVDVNQNILRVYN
ncbi:Rieske (2Fe-2S) protein [Flavobacterium seoulense]|uniref:Rieske domain-containing protein n=1 Tax=Flavobacterium seoulense TaxID=1492738 RepID=A0A066X0T3_9FLAO|nr:hypothetical protein [Flavobacterium seoulense]KDN56779.1 hypothetical protein FEM21_02820 [Flavobacterium seoulense]